MDALTAMKQALEAITQCIVWQQAAIMCEQWEWDSDQKEAAQGCLDYAIEQQSNLRTAIKEYVETKGYCAKYPDGFTHADDVSFNRAWDCVNY